MYSNDRTSYYKKDLKYNKCLRIVLCEENILLKKHIDKV